MSPPTCRFCRGHSGEVVLDLGEQPACDFFPDRSDPGPDPAYPLQMWLCRACHLAQLVADSTVAEEPKATEPAALVAQAAGAVSRVAATGWLPRSGRVAEYGSPHGGSWLQLLQRRGLSPAADGEAADVVLDCFGMMHAPLQWAAIIERAARVTPSGVLLLQFHSLGTIVRRGQWNALRHGHYAYYSMTALTDMLATVGFSPRAAWQFDLYGGTVLVAATRSAGNAPPPSDSVRTLLVEENEVGVCDPGILRGLQDSAVQRGEALHAWLATQRASGQQVLGYGAASRAVALLCRAGVDRELLPAIADASRDKQGLRMPGTHIPIVSPDELLAVGPDAVLLFLPDLLDEVRRTLPGVEAAGSRWVNAEALGD